jgi:hypothetical protein
VVGPVDLDALVEHVSSLPQPFLAPPLGRIQRLNRSGLIVALSGGTSNLRPSPICHGSDDGSTCGAALMLASGGIDARHR